MRFMISIIGIISFSSAVAIGMEESSQAEPHDSDQCHNFQETYKCYLDAIEDYCNANNNPPADDDLQTLEDRLLALYNMLETIRAAEARHGEK